MYHRHTKEKILMSDFNKRRINTGLVSISLVLLFCICLAFLACIPSENTTISCELSEQPEQQNEAPATSSAYVSQYCEYMAAAQALLAGELDDVPDFSYTSGYVYFGFEGESLVAYEKALLITNEHGEQEYELSEPIGRYPRIIGDQAQKKLSGYMRKYLNLGVDGETGLQLMGFIGRDFIVFTTESVADTQICCIFRTDDGSNWYEFGHNNTYPRRATGACILSDKVGFICYSDRYVQVAGDYSPRKLIVYRTEDGGESWEDIGILLPEDYESSAQNFALSPVFDGECGVMFVTGSEYNTETEQTESYTVWFESTDGGMTWIFAGK